MKVYARPVLAVLFVAMLATPALIRRYGGSSSASSDTGDPVDARARYGFRLTEVSKSAGLQFVHETPTLDRKLAHIMPQVASMGAAVSIADVDADGHPDVYATNSKEGSANRLFRNRGDGTFEEVAARFGVADLNQPGTGVSMGSVFGDYDNDGFEDLLLYRWGKPELFHNDGGRGFTRVTDSSGLFAWANVNTAVWLDFDRDGRLDLFLGGYYPERIDLWNLADTRMMPESFEYANNGGRKYLYRNLGGGRFEEVSAKVGLVSTRWSLGRGGCRPARHRVSRHLHRQRLRRLGAVHQRGRTLPRGRTRSRRRLRAQERHERVGRRRAEPGHAGHLRVEHLGGRDPDSGQQPLDAGGDEKGRARSTRTWPARWGSIWAAGASARSSGISTTTAFSISTSSTGTFPHRATKATGTTTRRWRAAIRS